MATRVLADAGVKRRVGAIKNLQLERKTLESQFYIDLLKIESKCWTEMRDPLYRKRSDIIAPKGALI